MDFYFTKILCRPLFPFKYIKNLANRTSVTANTHKLFTLQLTQKRNVCSLEPNIPFWCVKYYSPMRRNLLITIILNPKYAASKKAWACFHNTDLLIGCGKKIKIVRNFEVKLCGEKRQLCGKLCGIAQFFFHKKSLVKCCNKLAPAELNPTDQTVSISNYCVCDICAFVTRKNEPQTSPCGPVNSLLCRHLWDSNWSSFK